MIKGFDMGEKEISKVKPDERVSIDSEKINPNSEKLEHTNESAKSIDNNQEVITDENLAENNYSKVSISPRMEEIYVKEKSEKENEPDLKYKNKGEVAKGGILGAFIGLAVIVPGVSGSAVAIIFKMYEKLLYAIGNIFKKFKKCARFLLPIILGVAVGFVLGFFGVRALLNILPFIIICLFAGLMFGAYPAVTDQIKGTKPKAKHIVLFIVGLLIPILISVLSVYGNVVEQALDDLRFYHYILFVVIGYLMAVTQLVPGLSATALLMSLGYFTALMNSVSLTYFRENPMTFLVYGCLVVGFVIGLFTVSKGLSYMMAKHKASTFYTVAGLSLGSIVTMFFNPEVMAIYSSWGTGGNIARDLSVGIIVFILGVVLAYWFVRYERKKGSK